MSHKTTKSCGSTSRHFTRTQTRASKAVARTGGYPLCPPPVLCTRHMRRYRCLPWTEVSLYTTSTAATEAVVVPHYHRTSPVVHIPAQIPAMNMAARYIPATLLMATAMMKWFFPIGRCIEPDGHNHFSRFKR